MNRTKVLRHALCVAIVVLGLSAVPRPPNELPEPKCVWVEDPETGLMVCWIL
jgi:hypothetical protein